MWLYTLKKVDVLKKSDANVVATIIMNITLPCALLTSANGIELDATILILIAIGIISNVVMMIIGSHSEYKRWCENERCFYDQYIWI